MADDTQVPRHPVIIRDAAGDSCMDESNNALRVTAVANSSSGLATETTLDAVKTAVEILDDIVRAEDAVHGSGDTGVMALAVRNDALSALAGTDGDYAPIQVDADGALYTSEPSRVDDNNSSTATLTGDATFTGTSTDVLQFRNVTVSVFADQDSATNGLKIQFSSDGSNWDFEEDFTVSANTGETHTVPVMAEYYRVTYTNGASAQGAFRLQTVLVTDDLTGTVAPLNSGVGQGNQAVLTRSVLSAFNGTSYNNIQSTNGGNLKISLQEASDGMDIGAGNAGGETLRVSIATDDVNLSGILADTANMDTNLGTVAGAVSGSEMQVDVVAALPAGTNAIGKLAANSGVDIGDVDVTSISAGSNLIGDVGISGARTSGGTTIYRNLDVDESEDEIKSSAGQVYWIHAMNLASGARYLKFYNATAASVTVGSTTPVLTFPIATQGDTNGAGFTLSIPNGIAFDTAITVAATTAIGDADTGAPGANEIVLNLGYA